MQSYFPRVLGFCQRYQRNGRTRTPLRMVKLHR